MFQRVSKSFLGGLTKDKVVVNEYMMRSFWTGFVGWRDSEFEVDKLTLHA